MSSPTHHWITRLADTRKPAYLAIPDLIEEDLATGRLRPRDRLPGLRDLAEELALNYTTVARAYAEARKRGLLDSRAGSGTFVRGRTATTPDQGLSTGRSSCGRACRRCHRRRNAVPSPAHRRAWTEERCRSRRDGARPQP